MHIFVYEYLSSRAPGDAVALPSLQTEGWAILSAVLEDLARCPGVQVSTLMDCRRTLPRHWSDRIVAQQVQPAAEEDAFRELAAVADWSLVIAPEFDGILAERSRWVEEVGGRLLGCSTAAVNLTADKLTLACHWKDHEIPTPIVIEWPSWTSSTSLPYPVVTKPRAGAGSQATFLVDDDEELSRAVVQAGAEGWSSPLILQAYSPGLAVSVAFLASGDKRYSLPAVEQRLSRDGRFRYLGGRLPLPEKLDFRARRLAERAVECVEGLHGWFGVDLVLGDAEDGSGDVAIEINPRLTTSYLGLRRLAQFNLAEALIATVTGLSPSSREWKTESIVFDADGQV